MPAKALVKREAREASGTGSSGTRVRPPFEGGHAEVTAASSREGAGHVRPHPPLPASRGGASLVTRPPRGGAEAAAPTARGSGPGSEDSEDSPGAPGPAWSPLVLPAPPGPSGPTWSPMPPWSCPVPLVLSGPPGPSGHAVSPLPPMLRAGRGDRRDRPANLKPAQLSPLPSPRAGLRGGGGEGGHGRQAVWRPSGTAAGSGSSPRGRPSGPRVACAGTSGLVWGCGADGLQGATGTSRDVAGTWLWPGRANKPSSTGRGGAPGGAQPEASEPLSLRASSSQSGSWAGWGAGGEGRGVSVTCVGVTRETPSSQQQRRGAAGMWSGNQADEGGRPAARC